MRQIENMRKIMNNATRKLTNQMFLIKVTYKGQKTQLVGAGQLHKHVGKDWTLKLIDQAFGKLRKVNSNKVTFKLRRGIKIEFYAR